jgi:hypothetical protein
MGVVACGPWLTCSCPASGSATGFVTRPLAVLLVARNLGAPASTPAYSLAACYAARRNLRGSTRIRSIGRYLPTASTCSADASESRTPTRSFTLRRSL